MRPFRYRFFVPIIAALLFGCAPKKTVVTPPPNPVDESAFREDVAQGDSFFALAHLYGWRRAEAEYESALEIRADSEVVEKLRLTRYLILDREMDEEIYASGDEERLASICSEATKPFQTMLCGLAERTMGVAGVLDPPPAAKHFDFPEEGPLIAEDPALRAYLGLRCALANRQIPVGAEGSASSSFTEGYLALLPGWQKRAPLMLYVKLQSRLLNERELFLNTFPRFAELFCARGQSLLAAERYRDGIAALERTLQLIPDHTGALLQLGNLYLFTFEHHSKALEYFDQALKVDPDSVEGLFGRGVALHGLGRYLDSQVALERLLDAPDVRWSTVRPNDRPYYRSNGYYYRAFNAYQVGSRTAARNWVDLALQLDPAFDGSHYLSGMLRFDEGDIPSAQAEFQRVIEGGTTICNAYYMLGVIAAEHVPHEVGPYFLNNGICLERGMDAELRRIAEFEQSDLDPEGRAQVLELAEKRVARLKSDALASALSMLNAVRSFDRSDDEQLLRSLDHLFDRLNAISVEPAGLD
ncbi:MAG: tetratricopeptide repeat protein [Acidobacteriota bacterium]